MGPRTCSTGPTGHVLGDALAANESVRWAQDHLDWHELEPFHLAVMLETRTLPSLLDRDRVAIEPCRAIFLLAHMVLQRSPEIDALA